MALAATTGGRGCGETFVTPPSEITTQVSASPTAALFAEASVETGTSSTKLTPLDTTGSVTREDASTVPFVATACIVSPASAVMTSWR